MPTANNQRKQVKSKKVASQVEEASAKARPYYARTGAGKEKRTVVPVVPTRSSQRLAAVVEPVPPPTASDESTVQRGDSAAESEEVEHQLMRTTEPEDEEPIAAEPLTVKVNRQKRKTVTWEDQSDAEEDAENDSVYVDEPAGDSMIEPGLPGDEYSTHSDERGDEEDDLLEPVIPAPKPTVTRAPKKAVGQAKARNKKPPATTQSATSLDKRTQPITLSSSSSLQDLEQEIRKHLKDSNTPLDLSYRTAWGLKTMRMALDDDVAWQQLLAIVGAKISGRAKMTEAYHVQVFHFMDALVEAKGKKGKAGVDKAPTLKSAEDDPLTQIIEQHKCAHGKQQHQCFFVTEDVGAPEYLVGKCLPLSNKMQVLWAEECRLGRAGVAELPRKMVKELLQIEEKRKMAAEEEERKKLGQHAQFQPVPPKPRGRTGPVSVSQRLALPYDVPQNEQYQPPPMHPNEQYPPHPMYPWGGFYGGERTIIIQGGAMESPMKRALGIGSPVKGSGNRVSGMEDDGPPLEEWLQELDQAFGKGATPYSDLWPYLDEAGFANVFDIKVCPIPELAKAAMCSEVFARRLHARACAALKTDKSN